MLVKWIDCRVAETKQEEFVAAQAGWKALQEEPGFGGQVGGWVKTPKYGWWRARVVGLWKDLASHQTFLKEGRHDSIVQQNALNTVLDSWKVEIFQQRMPLKGQFLDLGEALLQLSDGAWLRAVECVVPSEQAPRFWQAQEELWQPAMAQVPGMLGGCVANKEEKILILTLWANQKNLEDYQRQTLPALRESCLLIGALPQNLVHHSFCLRTDWTVPALRYSLE